MRICFGKICSLFRQSIWYTVLMHKKVFIALKMAGSAGQLKLAGVFRYIREKYGDKSPWEIQLVRTRSELTAERVAAAVAQGADGFIMSIPDTEDAVGSLLGAKAPMVIMDISSAAIERGRCNWVAIRNSGQDIGREAARYLMGQGVARSYAFLHAAGDFDWSRDRCNAFRDELKDSGLWCEELGEPSDVMRLKRPAAVLAAHDDRAFDLLKFLRSKRLRVPRDVAVMGVDNDTLLCENTQPRLTSIQPDFESEGYLAAEALDAMMRGITPKTKAIRVGVREIVRRESTAELSQAGLLVQKALAFIESHALEGIGVADVVRHLGCSRRLADLRFRELQKRSILEAITERRLEEVKRLLRETRMKMDTIAAECGFSSPNYLKNLFKKRFAMSMRDFRRAVSRPR